MIFWVLIFLFLTPILHADTVQHEVILTLHQKALEHANLEKTLVKKWRKKKRLASLLPKLQFGLDQDFKNDLDVRVQDQVSVSSGGVVVGPESMQQLSGQNNNMGFEVKAVWQLNDLLFSGSDLAISREARGLARERERILRVVNRLYFEWLQLKKGKEELSVFKREQVEADLDAYTGGWFYEYASKK